MSDSGLGETAQADGPGSAAAAADKCSRIRGISRSGDVGTPAARSPVGASLEWPPVVRREVSQQKSPLVRPEKKKKKKREPANEWPGDRLLRTGQNEGFHVKHRGCCVLFVPPLFKTIIIWSNWLRRLRKLAAREKQRVYLQLCGK